ncbi:venom serine protease-like isoform X2 [Rhodnius prolixus]|uniref:venom serine protease-like isoform X2 n=1 Tax=Rhodnius prolixus TaxID=13249 RepID=UPI003D189B1D
MKLRLTGIKVFMICAGLTWANSDEDSSEYGVAEGDVGTNCTCGVANKDGERIVGGEEAKKNEYPMIASLVYLGTSFFCGGTIVTQRHVVTAAHCDLRLLEYAKDVDSMGVYVGVNKVKGEEAFKDGQYLKMKEFRLHPEYRADIKSNDIAVILLQGEINFNTDKVAPACLPLGNEDISGKTLKAIGWGDTKSGDNTGTTNLMKVDLDVIDHSSCEEFYHILYNQETNICVESEGKDTCQGDSGGPLLWRDPETNRYVLVAVTSYGIGCAEGVPGVYSSIIHHLPWIQSVISATDSSQKTCAKDSN